MSAPGFAGGLRAELDCHMAITFVTTTSYGSWLPGDLRGYVRHGMTLPSDPTLLQLSRQLMTGATVYFSVPERDRLIASLHDACNEFGYRLSDAAVESWHVHWILAHGDDTIDKVVGRLKTRMRQAIARGRIWTEGYCAEPLFDESAIEQAQEYIARHDGCRMNNGQLLERRVRSAGSPPGKAGG